MRVSPGKRPNQGIDGARIQTSPTPAMTRPMTSSIHPKPAEKTLVADLVGGERKGLAFGWYNFAIGVATLPSSLIFGALYQVYGALAAFGWGVALAIVAVVLLTLVRATRKPASLSCMR
jgi:predicted MFS family arabinose efflux permease